MRIVHLSIKNFRGIRELEWSPPPGATCLVGHGDAGKTTILEAIELVLLPRTWSVFIDSDFHGLSTVEPIKIEVTIVDVPNRLLTQEKFGLEQRGWTTTRTIRDEPLDEDEPALTIRLLVDETLEPTWHVVSDRNSEGKAIAARDREALGVLRVGEDADRHLSWARGSSLARTTSDPDSVSKALATAHRTARDAVSAVEFEELSTAAIEAGDWGARYGAQLSLPLGVGIDPRQFNVGSGALSLRQAAGVPARAVGLGSRRLLALAIQRQTATASVVTLVDEVEHGLEPHRLRHLLSELRKSAGQVLMTTHSETAVAELGVTGLAIVRRGQDAAVSIIHPDPALQPVIRGLPEAVLARRIIVAEGQTEFGLARGLVSHWNTLQAQPLAFVGSVFVPAGGSQAAHRAASFRSLGYEVCYWADSDAPITPSVGVLEAAGVSVITWSDNMNTEQRIMADVPEETLGALWAIAAGEKGEETVAEQLASTLGVKGSRPTTWEQWLELYDLDDLRSGLGTTAATRGWYKNIRTGQSVGALIALILDQIPDRDLTLKLNTLQAIAYAD